MIRNIFIILLLLLTQVGAKDENNSPIKKLSEKIQINFVDTTHTLPAEILNRLSAKLFILRKNKNIPLLELLEEEDTKVSFGGEVNITGPYEIGYQEKLDSYLPQDIPNSVTINIEKVKVHAFLELFSLKDENLEIELTHQKLMKGRYYLDSRGFYVNKILLKNNTNSDIEINTIILTYNDSELYIRYDVSNKFLIKKNAKVIKDKNLHKFIINELAEFTEKRVSYRVTVNYTINGRKKSLSKLRRYTKESIANSLTHKVITQKINKNYDFITLEYYLLITKAIEIGDENSAINFTNELIQSNIETNKNLTEEQLANYALLGKVYKNFQYEAKSKIAYQKRLEIFRKIKKDMPKERFEILNKKILKDAQETNTPISMLLWILIEIILVILMVKQISRLKGIKVKLFIIFRYFIYTLNLLLIFLGLSFIYNKDTFQDATTFDGIFLSIFFSFMLFFIHRITNKYIKELSDSKNIEDLLSEQSIKSKIKKEEQEKECISKEKSSGKRDFKACRNCSASEVEIENGIYICSYCSTAIGNV